MFWVLRSQRPVLIILITIDAPIILVIVNRITRKVSDPLRWQRPVLVILIADNGLVILVAGDRIT
jgi:hypothetical protein